MIESFTKSCGHGTTISRASLAKKFMLPFKSSLDSATSIVVLAFVVDQFHIVYNLVFGTFILKGQSEHLLTVNIDLICTLQCDFWFCAFWGHIKGFCNPVIDVYTSLLFLRFFTFQFVF